MTTPLVIATIVEGQGDAAAVPILLRRICLAIDPGRHVKVDRPIRVGRDKLLKQGELERYVALAVLKAGDGGALLVLLDADDDCPATAGPALLARSREVRSDLAIAVVLAKAEFEGWFLAAAASLGGHRGLPGGLTPPDDPEGVRDAKGWLQRRRTDGYAYSPTTDQPALASAMDIEVARARAPSFAKLWRDLQRLMQATS